MHKYKNTNAQIQKIQMYKYKKRNAQIQKYKCTNKNICTNAQIQKYKCTNTKTHKNTNAQIKNDIQGKWDKYNEI